VEIDWRAHLHPSARPIISTGASSAAKDGSPESDLTAARDAEPPHDGRSNRRNFTDDEKLAVVLESEQPGVSVAEICRRHGIVTSMVFRWRVQFGFASKKPTKLATVTGDGTAGAVLPPKAAIRMRFASKFSTGRLHDDDRSGRREGAPGARLHRHEKGRDGLAMLVQETLKKDPFSGHLFAFRGKRAQIVKILFWDGNGLCLFTNYLHAYCTSFDLA
jgi:transposase-like protein